MDIMTPMTAAEMKNFVRREIDQWSEVVKAAKLEPK
jgi:tripartite-type tricarboxylate transporter receptor subunit TctC